MPRSVRPVPSLLLLAALAAPGHAASPPAAYRQHCAPCHGDGGRGDGPDASMFRPPPRDLRDGVLQSSTTDELVRRVRDGQPLALDRRALDARAAEVEALVAHIERLPRVDWRLVVRGEEIWVDRCEACHGRFGRPEGPLPPGVRPPRDLSDPQYQRRVTDAELAEVVQHGRRGMPAIPALQDAADVPPLVAWVRLLSPGLTLYTQYCASCHGDDGRPTALGDESAAPRVVFDRAWVAANDPERLRVRVWHMRDREQPAMPHLRARLSDAQVRAIIEYLRAGPPGPGGTGGRKGGDPP